MTKFKRLLTVLFFTAMAFAVALALPACKSETFYDLDEAYYNGLLTEIDLQDISYFSQGYVYKNNYIDYVPTTKLPVLSAKQEQRILNAFKKQRSKIDNNDYDDLRIEKYLGKYNSYHLVEMYSSDIVYMFPQDSYTVGGFVFEIKDGSAIFLWG